MLEARTAIVRRYSRIRSALVDFLEEVGALPSPAYRFGWSDSEKFTRARSLIAADLSFSPHARVMDELIDKVEALLNKLNLVVHGFVEVREEKSGEIHYFFGLGGKRQAFTCSDLKIEAVDLDLFSTDTQHRLDRLLAMLTTP